MTDKAPRRYIELAVDRPLGQTANPRFEAFAGVKIADLNVEFEVVADRTQGPNTMRATVYGLSESSRYRLRKTPGTKVTLYFGYAKDVFPLFRGRLRSVVTRRQDTEVYTELEAGQGERARYEWVKKTYGKGTQLINVLEDLVESMDAEPGNLRDVLKISEDKGMPLALQKGFVANGHAADVFARIMGSRGLEWSIQTIGGRETIQVIKAGRAIPGARAIPFLRPGEGLIGIPTVDNKGLMTCDALIRQDVFPGRLVDIESKFLGDSGQVAGRRHRFKVTRAVYSGSLYGECKMRIEGRKVEAA